MWPGSPKPWQFRFKNSKPAGRFHTPQDAGRRFPSHQEGGEILLSSAVSSLPSPRNQRNHGVTRILAIRARSARGFERFEGLSPIRDRRFGRMCPAPPGCSYPVLLSLRTRTTSCPGHPPGTHRHRFRVLSRPPGRCPRSVSRSSVDGSGARARRRAAKLVIPDRHRDCSAQRGRFMAMVHRERIESTSKGCSISGKDGTPRGSMKALHSSS